MKVRNDSPVAGFTVAMLVRLEIGVPQRNVRRYLLGMPRLLYYGAEKFAAEAFSAYLPYQETPRRRGAEKCEIRLSRIDSTEW